MFVCKSKRLANYLIENGNPVIRIDTDQESKGFLVFLFNKNEKLNKSLKKWNQEKIYIFNFIKMLRRRCYKNGLEQNNNGF